MYLPQPEVVFKSPYKSFCCQFNQINGFYPSGYRCEKYVLISTVTNIFIFILKVSSEITVCDIYRMIPISD